MPQQRGLSVTETFLRHGGAQAPAIVFDFLEQEAYKESFLPRASLNSLLFNSPSLKLLSSHHLCQFPLLLGLTGLIRLDLRLSVACHLIPVFLQLSFH